MHQKSSFQTLFMKYSERFVLSWFLFGTVFREIVSTFCVTERNSELCSLPRNGSERNSQSLLLNPCNPSYRKVFSDHLVGGSRVCSFKPLKWRWILSHFKGILVPRNGIPSCFLFRGRVRNGIPRFSVPRNNRNSVGNNHLFRLFRLPRNYFFVGNSQP